MRTLPSLPIRPSELPPRSSSGQRGGNDSNGRLFQISFSEDICARLRVFTSSRHSGPAFIAVKISRIAENVVPINAATVSAPGLDNRFNNMVWRWAD